MRHLYTTSHISDNLAETPEGYLVCEGVQIARDGLLQYRRDEIGLVGANIVDVWREPGSLADHAVIASFAGKPVTLDHPPTRVDTSNWRATAVGVVQNVRAQDGALIADLLIADQCAIQAVKSGAIREVSIGFFSTPLVERDGRYYQQNIVGNHVALVPAGRCGPQCAIRDHEATMTDAVSAAPTKSLYEMLFGSRAIKDNQATITIGGPEAQPQTTQPVPTQSEPVKDQPDHMATMMGVLQQILTKLDALGKIEVVEPAPVPAMDSASLVAAAEIVAPGLKSKNLALDALTCACQGSDQDIVRRVIGDATPAEWDAATQSIALRAVAAAVAERRAGASRITIGDTSLVTRPGARSPDEINAENRKYYGDRA